MLDTATMWAVPIALAVCVGLPVGAYADEVAYGPEPGQVVTIIERHGHNTDKAFVGVLHRISDARNRCKAMKSSELSRCTARLFKEVVVASSISGDCVTGEFTNVYGDRFKFNGDSEEHASDDTVIFLKPGTLGPQPPNEVVAISAFAALCPARFGDYEDPGDDVAEADSPLDSWASQNSQEIIADLNCVATGSVMLGVPDIMGRDKEELLRVSITDAGDFIVSGRTVTATDARYDGSNLTLSMVNVKDLLTGMAGEFAAIPGVDAQGMQSLNNLAGTMYGLALGDRQRFAIFDRQRNMIVFADSNNGQFSNVREAVCF